MLVKNCQKYPENIIFGDSSEVLTGQETLDIVNKISLLISSSLDSTCSNVGIAILLPRNCMYLSSIFSIWQLGHYFIPLNDSWPEDHLINILNTAMPDLVISNRAITGFQTVALDKLDETTLPGLNEIKKWDKARVDAHLAYTIFTSGSTGQQKGVMISHNAYLAYIDWAKIYFDKFKNNEALLITAELTFDITMGDIAFALAHKTQIHVSPDPKNMFWHAQLIIDRKIDTFYSVPTTINRLFSWVKEREDVDFSNIKLVVSGGDSFGPELIELVKSLCPRSEFHNVYGPTEVTINCLAIRVDNLLSEIKNWSGLVPIGIPFPHLQTVLFSDEVLTDQNSGELLVGGAQCMEGYVGDPNLTKKSFIDINGISFYRTGDLVQRNDKGYMFIEGRIDNLVKIKGYRINPMEIDNIVAMCSNVKETKTIVISKISGESSLLCFYSCKDASYDVREECREICSNNLPQYMVPDDFLQLESLPLGTSGKISQTKLKKLFIERYRK